MLKIASIALALIFAPLGYAMAADTPTTQEECEAAEGMTWDADAGKCVQN